jgi:hypothetical protein
MGLATFQMKRGIPEGTGTGKKSRICMRENTYKIESKWKQKGAMKKRSRVGITKVVNLNMSPSWQPGAIPDAPQEE